VDHLCYKCQASIDETLPFCPHCGAPQIRVAVPEEDTSASPNPATPNVYPSSWPPAPPPSYPSNTIQWDVAAKGALLAGFISGVLSSIPIVGFGCCLWMLGAGGFAVWLYQRRIPGVIVTPGMGMRMGALSGAVGFFVTAIWWVFLFAKDSQQLRSAFAEQMEKSMAQNPDPHAQEVGRQVINYMSSPEGMATFFIAGLVVMAIIYVVFCAAGGALGASMFARRRNLR
jgi:hypothetical protein